MALGKPQVCPTKDHCHEALTSFLTDGKKLEQRVGLMTAFEVVMSTENRCCERDVPTSFREFPTTDVSTSTVLSARIKR
uniref:Uncharacterized protein n=1 Tax=Steinernema glaseri TaxID=37863 RepID=A0A1I7Z129_9BILA